MGFLDEFTQAGRSESPFAANPPGQAEVQDDDPLQSFSAMEKEALKGREDSVGQPISKCERPWLELTLYKEDGTPAAGAPYAFSVPGADGLSGNLDKQGFVHIDDVEVDTATSELRVEVKVEDDGEVSSYRVSVVPRKDAPPETVDNTDPEQVGDPLTRVEFDEPFEPY